MKDEIIQQPAELHPSLHKKTTASKPSETGQADVTSLIQISKIYRQLLDEAFTELQHALNVHGIADKKNKSRTGCYKTHDTEARIVKNTERLTSFMKDIQKYFHHARGNRMKHYSL